MELIEALGIDRSVPVVDVGGGASVLVDRLLDAEFTDVSVVDVSEVALETGRRRVHEADRVAWLREDILTWQPDRRYGLWHDRAVFHFLTEAEDRNRYLATMLSAVAPGGWIVMATFADDGPEYCSGLPVARYSPEELVAVLGDRFSPVQSKRELHTTPADVVQPFTWVAGVVA
jgi:trans-aconitate methyltransferase